MHLFLIASFSSYIPSLATLWVWTQVALGLGAVIFIHELGHFVVAKLCGVKCEKFYLGFDIFGAKIVKFQWGETEYGIGALPLGGYVKMLGQDDNPSAAKAEMDRAKAAGEEGGDGKPVYDPRSYMAQSVPERMAIISAGVIMNVIFAFFANFWAYNLGVEEAPSQVCVVAPGEPAWKAGLRTGAVIQRIENKDDNPRFDKDLIPHVVLADMEKGVSMTVQFRGESSPRELNVKPTKYAERKKPTIGIWPYPNSTKFAAREPNPDSAAFRCTPPLKSGDRILKVGDTKIENYADLAAILAARPADTLTLTVARPKDPEEVDSPTTELQVELPPNPLKSLGFVAAMGPVVAVQDNSPALKAGLMPGDQIEQIDGQAPGDPMTLDERLRRRGLKELTFTVKREGRPDLVEIKVTPREATWFEMPFGAGTAMSLPMLGVAYQVENKVAAVDPDGPAAKAGLKAGDVLTTAQFIIPNESKEGEKRELKTLPLESPDKLKGNMPYVLADLQMAPKGSKVALETKDGRKVELALVESRDFHEFERGLSFSPELRVHVAKDFSNALALATRETRDNVFQVYWFLQKLGTGQVDLTNLRGPGTIAKVAGDFAGVSFPHLLTFLAMLSANLAVINFLPIPVLDGGHMVFLMWEGIRGKPASEKVLVAFQYVGLAFIATLMVFVITMDVTDFVGYLSRVFG